MYQNTYVSIPAIFSVDQRPRGSIKFCTTGVLLAELEINQGLTNYSHVILDEVHERDCDIDISMLMLKQVTIQYLKLCAIFLICLYNHHINLDFFRRLNSRTLRT